MFKHQMLGMHDDSPTIDSTSIMYLSFLMISIYIMSSYKRNLTREILQENAWNTGMI